MRVAAARPSRPIERLTGAARFEAAMATRPCARTTHFMVHHTAHTPLEPQMSTSPAPAVADPVDDCETGSANSACRLGMVVPKRHAKRAATRNLIKRAVRAHARACAGNLPVGDWVVRLRAPFERKQFISAQSSALADVVRTELAQLFTELQRTGLRTACVRPTRRPDAAGHVSG